MIRKKQAAQHTILTEPDEERKGQSEVPQSDENKDRFMRGENESTQESSFSTGESDNRGSGANSLPPNDMKEQAETEEIDLKEIFLMIKNQQNTVNEFQKRQQAMQLQQEDITNVIIATVKKSMETEVKATHKLIQDQKEEIMSMLHSTSKKIDWSECSDVSDDEDGKIETKSIYNKIEDEQPCFIKIRFGDHRTKPEEAVGLAKKLSRERGIVAGTLIEFQSTNTTFTELPGKSQRRKAIKLTEKANDAQHNDLGLARSHIQSQTRELETGLKDTSIWDFLNCSHEYGNFAIGKTETIVAELFEIPINKLENFMVLPGISNQITEALQKEQKYAKIKSDELIHAFKQGLCAKGGEDNPAIQRFQEVCVNTPTMR